MTWFFLRMVFQEQLIREWWFFDIKRLGAYSWWVLIHSDNLAFQAVEAVRLKLVFILFCSSLSMYEQLAIGAWMVWEIEKD